jgi:AcrR family transcriptional regulator
MATGATDRDRAKADRHSALLVHAARLFAERGFAGVSLEDLGAAVGVSGPAVYRHFASKQALLGAILVGVSEQLRTGGERVRDMHSDPAQALDALVEFHVDFALDAADVIRVQDRDLAQLSTDDLHRVRRLQREYVDIWVEVLGRVLPETDPASRLVRAHACFGLINSTPHSVRGVRGVPADVEVRDILARMARAALVA